MVALVTSYNGRTALGSGGWICNWVVVVGIVGWAGLILHSIVAYGRWGRRQTVMINK
jgi:hypothetical protein